MKVLSIIFTIIFSPIYVLKYIINYITRNLPIFLCVFGFVVIILLFLIYFAHFSFNLKCDKSSLIGYWFCGIHKWGIFRIDSDAFEEKKHDSENENEKKENEEKEIEFCEFYYIKPLKKKKISCLITKSNVDKSKDHIQGIIIKGIKENLHFEGSLDKKKKRVYGFVNLNENGVFTIKMI